MEDERRNGRRRVDCQRRMVKRLLAVHAGLSAADLTDGDLSFDCVQRILRRLAMKGFVRLRQSRWVATPLLIGCPVVMTNGTP